LTPLLWESEASLVDAVAVASAVDADRDSRCGSWQGRSEKSALSNSPCATSARRISASVTARLRINSGAIPAACTLRLRPPSTEEQPLPAQTTTRELEQPQHQRSPRHRIEPTQTHRYIDAVSTCCTSERKRRSAQPRKTHSVTNTSDSRSFSSNFKPPVPAAGGGVGLASSTPAEETPVRSIVLYEDGIDAQPVSRSKQSSGTATGADTHPRTPDAVSSVTGP
jgi:hypothetical protein